ncbi:hypothetical protein HJFPF1_11247 [Paramyrothecium foliicola]|nr:hypothetical protein HJFPF1_11247 [Paramyrothecium foliicola]
MSVGVDSANQLLCAGMVLAMKTCWVEIARRERRVGLHIKFQWLSFPADEVAARKRIKYYGAAVFRPTGDRFQPQKCTCPRGPKEPRQPHVVDWAKLILSVTVELRLAQGYTYEGIASSGSGPAFCTKLLAFMR